MTPKMIDRLPWGELDNFIYLAVAVVLSLFSGNTEILMLVAGAAIAKIKSDGQGRRG